MFALRRCLTFSPSNELIVAGTKTGDFVIFHVRQLQSIGIYQTCVSGVSCIQCTNMVSVDPDEIKNSLRSRYLFNRILVGGGDGTVTEWNFSDKTVVPNKIYNRFVIGKYTKTKAVKLDSGVTALQVNATQEQVLAGTSAGYVYQIKEKTLDNVVVESVSETNPIISVRFLPQTNDKFVTCAVNGLIKLWSSNDYNIELSHKPISRIKRSAQCLDLNEEFILVGWYVCYLCIFFFFLNERIARKIEYTLCDDHRDNGDISAFDTYESDSELWEIKSAHKDMVCGIGISANQCLRKLYTHILCHFPFPGKNYKFFGHNFIVLCLFCQAQKYFVTVGGDGLLRVWDTKHRHLAANMKEHNQQITGLVIIFCHFATLFFICT
ncbi:hypothetical protein RFI_32328 [Reticulomyxa filosa]|uniref:WD_REPEATS_REGION domain-containing protein n=1 Tax=Reticulomyxa filosa TaxID=46433 RepID=X6LVA2_RETFI|nr:hypothetical protein RFI_32328 [Reticulomyxa filosa]|eukprot:ETO05072.1 hypothetical protein RFI_32328 [Reticulomyxa filosa]